MARRPHAVAATTPQPHPAAPTPLGEPTPQPPAAIARYAAPVAAPASPSTRLPERSIACRCSELAPGAEQRHDEHPAPHLLTPRPDPIRQIQAAHIRQAQSRHHRIRGLARQHIQQLLPCAVPHGNMSRLLQQAHRQLACTLVPHNPPPRHARQIPAHRGAPDAPSIPASPHPACGTRPHSPGGAHPPHTLTPCVLLACA